jgi:acetoin utilization protein AcuB
MEIIHIMTKHPETISPDDTLAKAQAMMDAGQLGHLPVVKNDAIVGMLTERDLRQHRGHLETTRVNAAMSTPVCSVQPNTTVQDAARLILTHKIGGLPVVDKGMLVGMVSTTDMIRAFLEVVEDYEKTRKTGAALNS